MAPAPIELPVEGLSDGVVRLRPMTDADVEAVAAACQDPEIARFTSVPIPYEERHAREWMRASQTGIAAGTDLALVVTSAEGDHVVGSVGLHSIDPRNGRCAAGYWIAREARSQGVAGRALALVCAFAFGELSVSRIELWIAPENPASIAVAERVGFTREGLLRSFMTIGGERRDMLMYSLLPGELA